MQHPQQSELDPLLGTVQSMAAYPMDQQQLLLEQQQQQDVGLGPGSQIHIGGCDFQISHMLGEGSFGAVWSALTAASGVEVAVKEIVCRSDVELNRAHMERGLLKFVGQGGQHQRRSESRANGQLEHPALAAAQRFPALAASEVQALSSDLWQVRLAMARSVSPSTARPA